MPDSRGFLSCSSCGKNQKQVTKLLAGVAEPRAFICDGCISRAHTALTASGQCSFCGEHHDRVTFTERAGEWPICADCLGRCDAILSEA